MQIPRSTPLTLELPGARRAVRLRGGGLRVRRPLNALLRGKAVAAACTPHDIDDYLALLDPTWSVREVRARVVGVQSEAGGAVSLFLVPNENWRGFRPGQYVRIAKRIGGVRYARCFSLSSAPHENVLRLTLKRRPDGRLSEWVALQARAGDVVELSQPMGEFVLSEPWPSRLLFVAGGSGITPFRSMLRHLLRAGYRGEVTCLHYARHEACFGEELAMLASQHAAFRYVPQLSEPRDGRAARSERVSRRALDRHAPAWAQSEVFVCGPDGLVSEMRELLEARQRAEHLHVERFVPAAPRIDPTADASSRRLVFATSGRSVEGSAGLPLLDQAERAGLRPAYGCRMGICHTCKCRKRSGAVRNELTGNVSSEPDEYIQLCVSTPQSDVTLEL